MIYDNRKIIILLDGSIGNGPENLTLNSDYENAANDFIKIQSHLLFSL